MSGPKLVSFLSSLPRTPLVPQYKQGVPTFLWWVEGWAEALEKFTEAELPVSIFI